MEGNNFDVRKHLLEYDDVLNSQRQRIYGERDRAFQKEDLHDDILDILRTELNERIPKSLKDDEGPWKLLSFLEEVQPSMTFEAEGVRAPSYTVRLMVEEAGRRLGESTQEASIRQVLLQIAGEALQAEREHILSATRDLLQKTEETIHQLERERLDSIDTFFEGLEDARDDETIAPRRPQECWRSFRTSRVRCCVSPRRNCAPCRKGTRKSRQNFLPRSPVLSICLLLPAPLARWKDGLMTA